MIHISLSTSVFICYVLSDDIGEKINYGKEVNEQRRKILTRYEHLKLQDVSLSEASSLAKAEWLVYYLSKLGTSKDQVCKDD